MATPARNTDALPPLFRHHIRRPRLTRLLDESTAQAIVLLAPAGYGKTTLAQEWLQGREDVAWYRGTPADADVAGFASHLADALETVMPGVGERVRQRVVVPDAPEHLAEEAAAMLASDLDVWPHTSLVVLDDYHWVASSRAVEILITRLFDLAPQLRMLVTTRIQPAWVTPRRRLHGDILVVATDALAFTNEEIEAVEGAGSGLPIHNWPVLVGLAAATETASPHDVIADRMFDYLADEVFTSQPEDVQQFMLVASVTSDVLLDLVAAVLPTVDIPRALSWLHHRGLITDKPQLGFHPLLREFLQSKLALDHPDLHQTLIPAAIDLLVTQDDWDEALRLVSRLGDREAIDRVVGAAASHLVSTGRLETIGNWGQVLSAVPSGHAAAVLLRSITLLWSNHASEAAAVASTLAAELPPRSPLRSPAFLTAGYGYHLAGTDSEKAYEHFRHALEEARAPQERLHALRFLAFSASDLEHEDALKYAEAIRALPLDDPLQKFSYAIAFSLAQSRTQGTLANVWPLLEPLVPIFDLLPNPIERARFATSAATMAISRADYPTALHLATTAREVADEFGVGLAVPYITSIIGNAQLGLGTSAAQRSVRELERVGTDPYFRGVLAIQREKLAILQQASIDKPPPPESPVQFSCYAEFCSVRAIRAAAAGRKADTESLLQEASATRGVEARFFSSFAQMILAARDASVADAAALARQTLLACYDADALDCFVWAYRAYPRIVVVLADERDVRPLLTKILLTSNDYRLAQESGLSQSSPASTLTKREREILTLVAEGLTNQEIASRLVISPNTVKLHVRHILAKTGARNRIGLMRMI
jgi:LuxR family maltose regulon positive regulatory protein